VLARKSFAEVSQEKDGRGAPGWKAFRVAEVIVASRRRWWKRPRPQSKEAKARVETRVAESVVVTEGQRDDRSRARADAEKAPAKSRRLPEAMSVS